MTILLPALAVTFCACCVWLGVRIINRRERSCNPRANGDADVFSPETFRADDAATQHLACPALFSVTHCIEKLLIAHRKIFPGKSTRALASFCVAAYMDGVRRP